MDTKRHATTLVAPSRKDGDGTIFPQFKQMVRLLAKQAAREWMAQPIYVDDQHLVDPINSATRRMNGNEE